MNGIIYTLIVITFSRLGLKLPQKKYPKLMSLTQEQTPDNELAFTLTFQSAETPYKLWAEPARVRRYETFFGPDVSAEVIKVDAEKRMVALRLTTGGPSTSSSSSTTESATAAAPSDDDSF